MRAVKGSPTEASQKGLKETLVTQNYFLACSCIPQEDMEIVLPDTQLLRKTTKVVEKTMLNNDVLRLRLTKPDAYEYYAGQYTTIFKDNTHGRSYSLSSVPELDDYLEFHIKLFPDGMISQWLHNAVQVGVSLTISEAIGNCIYLDKHQQQSLALIGTGTGLSPLYGILRDALHRGHQGEIRLYHGVRTKEDLYLHNTLLELAEQHSNVNYYPCISRETAQAPILEGWASDIALKDIGSFSGWCVYLCGNPDMVNNTKRSVFLAGASLQNIYADPFLHSQ